LSKVTGTNQTLSDNVLPEDIPVTTSVA